jgi:acylphosphatase
LHISGFVQGVGFRFFVREEALRLGLKGWVRNMPDGRVEAVAEGPQAALDELIHSCRRGPRGSEVDDVRVAHGEAIGEHAGFHITR